MLQNELKSLLTLFLSIILSIFQDPFESFRKQRAGAFYTRMRDKSDEKKKDKKDRRDKDRDEYTGETDY